MRILIFLFFFLLSGCRQEDFTPVRGYDEKLVVSCVLDSRSDTKILLIERNSDTWNFEKGLNFTSKINAKLISKDAVYIFKDTIIDGVTSFKTMYFNSPILSGGYYTLQISDSGSMGYKNISSTIYYPDKMYFRVEIVDTYYSFGFIANNNKIHAYIFYKQKINGEWVLKKEELPFVDIIAGKEVLFYPGNEFQTDRKKFYRIPFYYVYEVIERILSCADSDNLTILGGYTIFENYDYNLAEYSKTINMFSDPYSVRLDKPTFNNITNGLGIFGGIRIDTVKFFISVRGSHENP